MTRHAVPRRTGSQGIGDHLTGDRQTGGRQTLSWQTPDRQTPDRQTPDRQARDRQADGRRTQGRQTQRWQGEDRQTQGRQTDGRHTDSQQPQSQQTQRRQAEDRQAEDRQAEGRQIGYLPVRRWPTARSVAAVLFDRDGTLVEDVPYNGDPELVRPVAGARRALGLLRAAGVPTGVVSNQSGIGRGLLTHADVRRVNDRADALLGGLDAWVYCPHLPDDGCPCRKPRPGLVIEAARRLGVDARDCVVIGDIGADVRAAQAAGARGVLVPTPATLPEEVESAPATAPDLLTAVGRLLTGGRSRGRGGRS